MYKISITPKAKKQLRRLSTSDKLSIAEVIEELREDPLIGKPLSRGLAGRFSYRVGVYRIIYRVRKKDRMIEIISAGHRSTIYY